MTTTPASLPFRRRSHDRLLGGVCGAIADRTALDVGIVRVLAVVLALLGGAAVPIYLAAWLLIPEEGESRSPVERLLSR
jgi:phage shock protein PspC (stress-responsive transcriptional regulator)